MKVIDGLVKEIILEENDVLLISALHGNRYKLKITLNQGAIEIDDVPIKRIEQIKEEEIAIKTMEKYRKQNSKK